jgi:thiol-disulfide isomerase/thioredoxin
MNTKKRIWLVVVLVLIVGAIWYLESLKVHPGAGSGASQAINIGAAASSTNASGTMVEGTSSIASPKNSIVEANLQAIAAMDKKAGDQPAIEIADPTGFINVPSTFTLGSLIGKKVILIDFWTYSCINCIRTIPYLNAWYQKYENSGLVIVGIHTPEFDFEKNYNNVSTAVMEYGIKYPVVMDSNYGTWNAYNNLYWPNEYLIDIAGYIVHNHVGEGDYAASEAAIQGALQQRATALGLNPALVPTGTVNVTTDENLSGINSPETYFGADRNQYLGNGTMMTNGTQTLTAPASGGIAANTLYLGGTWDFEDQYATNNNAGATVTYEYDASKVYIVASAGANAPAGGVTMQVLQDGSPISAADAGSDVHNGVVTITGSRIYNLVNNADGAGVHTLELIINSPGLQAFTFTFG